MAEGSRHLPDTEEHHVATTGSGLRVDELTIEALRQDRLRWEDLRATPETLRRQSDMALRAGRRALAESLARAAELVALPSDLIMEIYTSLRPHRSTGEEIEGWATKLERRYRAPLTAAFLREARDAYGERGLLRTGERPTV